MWLEENTGSHGQLLDDALDPENDGWFEAVEVVDYAQAPIDRWNAEHKGKDIEAGTRVVVRNTRPADYGARR